MAFDNSNYYHLDYIQTNGNQYVKTGLMPNTIGRVEASVTFVSGSRQLLLCSWGSASNTTYLIERTATGNYNFQATGVTKSGGVTTALDLNAKHIIDVDIINNQVLIDNNKIATLSGSCTGTRELYLFASNDAETTAYLKCYVKLDYLKVYNTNGVLMKTFTPAMRKSDSVVGLFDEVNGTFYTNSGSGTFTYGSVLYSINAEANPTGTGTITGTGLIPSGTSVSLEAVPNTGYAFDNWQLNGYTRLDYIESTNTQWISTGISPQINFEVELEVARTGNNGSDNVILGMTNHTGTGYRIEVYNPSGKYKFYTSPTATGTEATTVTPDNEFVNLKYYQDANTQTLTINDDEVITKTGTTVATGYCDIFYYRSNASYYGNYKLRKFICKSEGAIVRNYIPVIRHFDGAIGLLDLVEMKFYGNSGTGTFIGGGVYAS